MVYSEFVSQVNNGNIRRAEFGDDGRTISGMTRNGQSYKTVVPTQYDPTTGHPKNSMVRNTINRFTERVYGKRAKSFNKVYCHGLINCMH